MAGLTSTSVWLDHQTFSLALYSARYTQEFEIWIYELSDKTVAGWRAKPRHPAGWFNTRKKQSVSDGWLLHRFFRRLLMLGSRSGCASGLPEAGIGIVHFRADEADARIDGEQVGLE